MERETDTFALGDYLAVLRRQWVVITVITVAVAVLGVAAFYVQTPTYRAQSELVIEPVRAAQDISLNELLNPTGVVGDTELASARSAEVAERAATLLDRDDGGSLAGKVEVSTVEGTARMRFAATDPNPQQAARIADAFASAFVEYRRDQAVASIREVRDELDSRSQSLRERLDAIDEELSARTSGVSTEGELADLDRQTLQTQRQALESQLAQVVSRDTELGESVQSLTGLSAEFTSASVPSSPVGADWLTRLGVSLVLGLLLGIGLAFARDHFDDLIREEAGLKRGTGGRPILGRIPIWKPEAGKGATDRVASVLEPTSAAAEAYRELSAGVRFMLVARTEETRDRGHHGLGRSRSVIVCSASMGEGKTATAANLAVATARVGLRTVLVDADLRRSAIAARFGLPRGLGLSDALLNGESVADYLVDVGVDGLQVLPAGTVPPNPTELLASPGMHALQRELLETAELVVYDTPAVLAVPDALEIGPLVDLGVIVSRVGSTSRRRVQDAIERLEQVGTDISGAVLNGLDPSAEGYYYSYYLAPEPEPARDGSGEPPDEGRRPWSRPRRSRARANDGA